MIKHIWIDADSCPRQVRSHSVKTAHKLCIPITFVANKQIDCDEQLPFEMIVTDEQKDSADTYILEHAEKESLVITRDIVFADKLVQKEIITINDRGTEFTKEMIKERLSDRDFDLQLAEIGLVKHYHEGYDNKKFEKFANCLDRVIVRNM